MAEVRDLDTGFVGRAAELAAGQAELARISAGVSVLAVTGEPGIGKSRYLSEIRRHAERAGWLVAAGQASEQERELPFSAFADALTPLVLGHPALVAGLPVGLADAVGAVLPAVGEPPSTPGTILRHHAHLATQALLERLTADRLRETTTRKLRRLGRRVVRNGKRDQGSAGWAALSQRERQVANGDTNRAIAAELFLSEKTIEQYLSSTFVKLGVSSRTALAILLEKARAPFGAAAYIGDFTTDRRGGPATSSS
ncbi:MAG: LuxR family transcriptional regulator [Sciscionella sp.]